MQKPQKVLLLTLVGLPIAIAVVLVSTQPYPRAAQPVYKGLELAQWLDIVVRHRVNGYFSVYRSQGRQPATDATPAQVHEAEEAVRAIGTNALPHLLAWINLRPNALKRFYRGVIGLLPIPDHMRGFLWGLPGTKDDRLTQFAVEGFRVLNTNALPALADLSKLANDTDHPFTQTLASKALVTVTNGYPR